MEEFTSGQFYFCAAFLSKASPRLTLSDPWLARKRVSASNSASMSVVISSISRLTGVPLLFANAFNRECFSSGVNLRAIRASDSRPNGATLMWCFLVLDGVTF